MKGTTMYPYLRMLLQLDGWFFHIQKIGTHWEAWLYCPDRISPREEGAGATKRIAMDRLEERCYYRLRYMVGA